MAGKICSVFLLVCLLLLASCSSLEQRRRETADFFANSGWQRQDVATDTFRFASWQPPGLTSAERLRIYIEGDGLAWINRYTPSNDPTPLDPLAFKLALADPSPHVLYLARPCQFVSGRTAGNCDQRFWTSHRFAEEVVTAGNAALDAIKLRFDAEKLELVGYSGGAALALLMAAERSDVHSIITVAGNLDHSHWTAREGYTPLWASLNPPQFAAQLAWIPQRHFVGAADETITPADVMAYQSQLPPGHRSEVIVIDDFAHHCCWADVWPELLNKTP